MATKKFSKNVKKDGFKLNVEGQYDPDKFCIQSKSRSCGCSGAGYGLGFIGAVVYYISTATSFWMGVLGVLKAIVWPAFLVYEVLKYLGM